MARVIALVLLFAAIVAVLAGPVMLGVVDCRVWSACLAVGLVIRADRKTDGGTKRP